MVPPGEIRPDPRLLARILELAGLEMILVGGQALAFWAAYYSVPAPPIAVTKDLSRVYGNVSPASLAKRALVAESPAGSFRIMHPLDVLQGRLENLHGLIEKQDEHGIAQLQLAVAMVREFLQDITSQEAERRDAGKRPVSLRHLRRIESLALSDAGRKVAQRYAVHVADSIDPAPFLHIESFKAKKLPQLLRLMSDERQAQLTAATQ